MVLKLSSRDLIVGAGGALLSGVVVWLLTEKVDLSAQLRALEEIAPKVKEAKEASDRALMASDRALIKSEEAINQAEKAVGSIRDSEKQAKEILSKLKATPLFEKVDESMDELRAVAASVARDEAQKNANKIKLNAWCDCYNASWASSFDSAGWSTCKEGYFMVGLHRSHVNCAAPDNLGCIETAKCCMPCGA